MTTQATDATTEPNAVPADASAQLSQAAPVQFLKAHLALNVRSVARSLEFYRKLFGLEPSKVRPGYAKFDVQQPPLNLTLNEVPFNERGALSHLGLQVATTADVLAMRARWQAAGLETYDEMQTDCCYALQDKTWVRDPDGNEWEAFVVLQDNLAATSMCCVTGTDEQGAQTLTCATTGAPVTPEASCCDTTAPPVGIERAAGGGGVLAAQEFGKPLNVCQVFEDEQDDALVVRWC
ncbi:MAG TPA: ArsI/CadI family heavy metal resistance metalloenzyme [Pyrinomonadaceae bacterium]|jgi:catechol 2,3-dioxygenase-like lactoylglutathione lyase family enzyme